MVRNRINSLGKCIFPFCLRAISQVATLCIVQRNQSDTRCISSAGGQNISYFTHYEHVIFSVIAINVFPMPINGANM